MKYKQSLSKRDIYYLTLKVVNIFFKIALNFLQKIYFLVFLLKSLSQKKFIQSSASFNQKSGS